MFMPRIWAVSVSFFIKGVGGYNIPYDGSNVGIKLGHQDTRSNNYDVQYQNMEDTGNKRYIKITRAHKTHLSSFQNSFFPLKGNVRFIKPNFNFKHLFPIPLE